MKDIKKMTEQEILALSGKEIEKMIKFRMAEEGIKFAIPPKRPDLIDVKKPKTTVYYSHLFGMRIGFCDITELRELMDLVGSFKTMCTVGEDYNFPSGSRNYIKRNVENSIWGSEPPETIASTRAYTFEEFSKIKGAMKDNAEKMKVFDAELKEYNKAIESAQWVRDEIENTVNKVVKKFKTLNDYVEKFKSQYLPLAENNEDIAMKFMDKAYALKDEQIKYILENYKMQSTETKD